MQTVQSQLDLLGDDAGAKLLTWKSWRAGKATQLAKDGYGLGTISEAGEWSKEGRFLLEDGFTFVTGRADWPA